MYNYLWDYSNFICENITISSNNRCDRGDSMSKNKAFEKLFAFWKTDVCKIAISVLRAILC